jgi:hypothetical protein
MVKITFVSILYYYISEVTCAVYLLNIDVERLQQNYLGLENRQTK